MNETVDDIMKQKLLLEISKLNSIIKGVHMYLLCIARNWAQSRKTKFQRTGLNVKRFWWKMSLSQILVRRTL